MQPVRWGIAGPGRIADAVARDFRHVPDASLIAVGSRSAQRAAAFAAKHAIPRAHGSYQALLDDDEVDVVYVATPHPQHHALALGAIRAGKAVLVEKAFTVTEAGTQQIIDAATAAGVFVMEAMWTRFQPALRRVRRWVDDGAIGELRTVEADLGVVRPFDPADRLFAPELAGGALLDLTVYPASFAQWFLGTPETVSAHGRIGPTGVEQDATLLLGYPGGASAMLSTSLRAAMPGSARLLGRDGWIDVLPRFHHPTQVVLHRSGRLPEPVLAEPDGVGYSHELAEVTAGVLAGRTQSDVMPLADSLTTLRVLIEAGRQLGVSWREDDAVL